LQELFETELIPRLAAEGVDVLKFAELNQTQRYYLKQYFERIFPILTPLAVDPSHPFPVMSNLSLNLAIVLKDPETDEAGFARVKVPDSLPRFVPLPPEFHPHSNRPVIWAGVSLEQVIASNLDALFPGMLVQEHHLFRVTRDADLAVQEEDIFYAIRQGDLLVHHPYESFATSVERFITHAAQDLDVQAIKMTLYRTSSYSPIIKALIAAAQNGKQVVALVEIKARFDEASNINWARALEEAGVHVVYGVMGLKTHTKVLLVVRQNECPD
jgi:polyphosphate kinase